MDIKTMQAILEGILFAAGDAVSLNKLSEILEADQATVRSVLKKMMDEYSYDKRGIRVIQLEDSYQMCSAPEYYEFIAQLVQPRRTQSLSNAAIEVLAMVAYKQPVTRAAVEHIRGVNSDSLFNKLLERNLIEEVGRLDAPGRPILFGTTQEFLRCFGIRTLSDLPDFDALRPPADDEEVDKRQITLEETEREENG